MKDFFGNLQVSRYGILIRQVHLDRDLGHGSNSCRWGAPSSMNSNSPARRPHRSVGEEVDSTLARSNGCCVGSAVLRAPDIGRAGIAQYPIPLHPLFEHPGQPRDVPVHVVVDPYLLLVGEKAVQASCVLDQSPFPGDGEGEEERVETGIRETFAPGPAPWPPPPPPPPPGVRRG